MLLTELFLGCYLLCVCRLLPDNKAGGEVHGPRLKEVMKRAKSKKKEDYLGAKVMRVIIPGAAHRKLVSAACLYPASSDFCMPPCRRPLQKKLMTRPLSTVQGTRKNTMNFGMARITETRSGTAALGVTD